MVGINLPKLAQPGTLLAQRLSTSALLKVLFLNIVPSITARIVVVHRLLSRIPRTFLSHQISPLGNEIQVKGEKVIPSIVIRETLQAELRDENLACWCKLDAPCHADVLLRIANEDI